MTVARPVESSPEVQELLISLQENYPDGLPAEVQAKVDHLKKTTTTDLKKHIGQLTKVKKDLDSMREARIKHMQAWKQHVTNLVENTKAQLQQYQQVMADFENCESELVAMFDNSRRAILQITQQTTPAEEDMKAIKEVDSGLLAGGAEMPIEVDGEEPSPGPGRTEVDADDMNRLQESFMECIAAAAEGKRGERPRSRSRRRGETEEGKETIRKDLWDADAAMNWQCSQYSLSKTNAVTCGTTTMLRSGNMHWEAAYLEMLTRSTSTTISAGLYWRSLSSPRLVLV